VAGELGCSAYKMLFWVVLSKKVKTPQELRRQGIIIGLLIAMLGLPYGTYCLWDFWRFISRAQEAQGQIVARDSTTFTIRFEAEGRTFQIEEDLPSRRGTAGLQRMVLQPGATVTVLYDPSSPQNAKWKTERLWVFPVAIILVSTLAGLVALFPDFMSRSWRSS
jgi:Protein of unknown function (DUF3592)